MMELPIRPKTWKLLPFHGLDALREWIDPPEAPVPQQDHEPQPLLRVCFAQFLRADGVTLELILKEGKYLIESAYKLCSIGIRNEIKMTHYPAFILESPIIGKTEKFVIGCDIREKGELPATQQAVLAFASQMPQTSQRKHALGHFVFCKNFALRFAFIPAIGMLEFGRVAQRCPLAPVCCRDRFANVAAKWLAGGVLWRAFFAAIHFGDGEIKARIKRADIFGAQVVGRAKNAVGHQDLNAVWNQRWKLYKNLGR